MENEKVVAAGIDSIQVDGNDVVAVYSATRDAILSGKPTVIECITYRMGLHTTSDDPTKYRTDSELEIWKQRDPISRLKKYLESKNLWNEEMENKAKEEDAAAIDNAVETAEKFNPKNSAVYAYILAKKDYLLVFHHYLF